MEFLLSGINGEVLLAKTEVAIDTAAGDQAMTEEGMAVDPTAGGKVKDPILSSWLFVIGVSIIVLAASVALGIFLAKRKIKKGIELYED